MLTKMLSHNFLNHKFFLAVILCSQLKFSCQSDFVNIGVATRTTSTTTTTVALPKIVYLGSLKPSVDIQFFEGSTDEDNIYTLVNDNVEKLKLSISLNFFFCHYWNGRPSLEITKTDALTGVEFKNTWECRNVIEDTIKDARSIAIKLNPGNWNNTLFAASVTITAYQETLEDECPEDFSFDCNGHLDWDGVNLNDNVKHCIKSYLKCNGRRNCGGYDYDENQIDCQNTTTERTSTEYDFDIDHGFWNDYFYGVIAFLILIVVAIVVACCCCSCCTASLVTYCCFESKKFKPDSPVAESDNIEDRIGDHNSIVPEIGMVPKRQTTDKLPEYAEVKEV